MGHCLETCNVQQSQNIKIPSERGKLLQITKLRKFKKVTRLKRSWPMGIWTAGKCWIEEPLVSGITSTLDREPQGLGLHEDHPWWGGIFGDAVVQVSYPTWVVLVHACLGNTTQCSGSPWNYRLRCTYHSITWFAMYSSALLPAQAHPEAAMIASLAFTPVSTLPKHFLSLPSAH